MAPCDCHESVSVEVIADWMCGNTVASRWRVRERAAMSEIWDQGRCELSRAELTARIQVAGGIGCEHALEAMTRLSGDVDLVNGLHRWAVAMDLGISEVPVMMIYEAEPAWAWTIDGQLGYE